MTVVSTSIRDQLGKVGDFDLAGSVLNGLTRTHAVSGWLKINHFQIANGNAPSEFVAPFVTTDWDSYVHTSLNSGNDLEITAEGYGEIDLLWSLPTGYALNLSSVTQRVYWKDMGTSLDLSVNPFDTPTGSANAGDGTTHTISGLTEGHFYAVGVKVEWDDSVTVHENADSDAYDPDSGATPLTGAGEGIASDEVFGDTPNFSSLLQTTDPDSCIIGADVNLRLTVNMEGPSTGELQEEEDGGGFSTIDSSVTAGTTQINLTRESLINWGYRIRYNDVGSGSPGPYSVERDIDASCTLP